MASTGAPAPLKLKDRAGIMFAHNRMISLHESKRALDGIVTG